MRFMSNWFYFIHHIIVHLLCIILQKRVWGWMVSLHKQHSGILESVRPAFMSGFSCSAIVDVSSFWLSVREINRVWKSASDLRMKAKPAAEIAESAESCWQQMCRSKSLWPKDHTSQSALIPSITYRVSLSIRAVPASANTHTSEFPLFPLGRTSAPFIKILYLFIWLTAKPHLLCLLRSVPVYSDMLYGRQFYHVISRLCTAAPGADHRDAHKLHTNK